LPVTVRRRAADAGDRTGPHAGPQAAHPRRAFARTGPLLVQQIRDIIVEINEQGTAVLLIEQNANMALSIAHHGYVMETGKMVMDGDPEKLLKDEDVKEFYLGLHGEGGERKSFRDVKHYKRRKRWLS
jgi:branched-chain amino acid transport system ATP-binding protein